MDAGAAKKILVVDDEPSITELLNVILTGNGYKVSIAGNGKEGLEKFNSIEPDLVISDIVMPDMEGIEFIRTLLKSRKNLPVIAISGNVLGTKFFDTARIFGVKTSLKKPFTGEKLLDAVKKILGD